MCFQALSKKIKNLDIWDISLTKLSVAAFVLFIITIWPAAMLWVRGVNPWYFLIAFIIFAIRPFYRMFKK
tara:strand:- start:184 stop:393 length:210 start_codon:yes stop_codon:yes gene_type:complete